MEAHESSKYRSIPWRRPQSSSARFRLDGVWKYNGIFKGASGCEPARSCTYSPYSQSGAFSSIRQLCDVAEGLNYIHSRNVVHGAIKGVRTLEFADNLAEIAQSNLLVDHLGRARVTDFILAAVNQNQCSTCGVAKAHSLNTRWSAPEVSEFSSEIGPLTDKADVFSFAMVIIEVSRGTCCATIFV